MSDFISVYMTAANLDEAERIVHTLVENRLAACANILPGARSIYRWQDRIETADEVVVIAKSRADLFPQIEEKVKQLSSYDCPCVVAWAVVAGHDPYLNWLQGELQELPKT